MDRRTLLGLGAAGAAGLLAAGCSSSTTGGTPAGSAAPAASGSAAGGKKLSVVSVVNGPLGDASFFDDAERGIQKLKASGHTTQTVQSEANNPAQWKTNVESVSTGKWDIVVVGSSQMVDIVDGAAKKFPNQKFIIYDDAPKAIPTNLASIQFKQNEGSFLAGALAALVVTNKDKFPNATGNAKTIGLVGGMDIPVINDFVAGYKKGAESVDPSVQVKVSYVGNFTDAQKGYDQAKAMFDQGADVVYQVAGGAGIGVLKAAKEAKRYAIGVDSNQNELQPGFILASMLKNIGEAIVTAVEAADAGKLEYGKVTSYGLANKGVGLTFEKNGNLVPADMQAKINDLATQVASGKIVVPIAPR
ncbi:MAG TPA: BMP family ABC transporter substrate-binding protein [Propionibacteriaceae bacterium]|nr:BMP family ABC transporter substrate-binding protein [Propionibacteriaceae bacterium]HPZ49456.1 BMP family ABC transporter substrate-binding protein [Propionibacteriaceae bacterium]